MKQFFLFWGLLFFFFGIQAQEKSDSVIVIAGEVYYKDSLPDLEIPAIAVQYKPPGYYQKLRRDVFRAYPYAIRVVSLVEQVEAHTETIKKKKHKKRYIKKKEKIMKDLFEDKMKKLTKRQGRILVRLINREMEEDTVYDLIKEYKNGVNARMWQIVAKKYDSDLKAEYDPDNPDSEDYDIELIVEEIEKSYKTAFSDDIVVDPPTYRDLQP